MIGTCDPDPRGHRAVEGQLGALIWPETWTNEGDDMCNESERDWWRRGVSRAQLVVNPAIEEIRHQLRVRHGGSCLLCSRRPQRDTVAARQQRSRNH